MLDNDNLTYSYQKRSGPKSAERALITVERSQKLDLLVHLLTNLQQSLVVCGPQGIGKTTLLQTLRETCGDIWHFVFLPGSSALSFEGVMQQLSLSLNLSGSGIGFDSSALRAFCDKQKVALIIDDAGELVPGLIGELAAFAESLKGLRAVFALTHDEFHIKGATDRALDECHVIELPPLNRRQTLDYLQNLSAQPSSGLSFNAITDELADDLYRETHGIPGRLLAELPKLNQYQNRQQRRWGLWLGVAIAAAGAAVAAKFLLPEVLLTAPPAVSLQATETGAKVSLENTGGNDGPAPAVGSVVALPQLQQSPTEQTQQTREAPLPVASSTPASPPVVLPTSPSQSVPAVVPPAPPQASSEPVAAPLLPSALSSDPAKPGAPNSVEKPVETVTAAPPAKPTAGEAVVAPDSTAVAAPSAPSPVKPAQPQTAKQNGSIVSSVEAPAKAQQPSKPVPEKKPADVKAAKVQEASANENDWIMAQPAKNYTLQVMTLSTKEAALRFMKKYADYGEALKYYALGKTGQEKFVVIYGSFESAAEARQYKEVMPGEFKKAMEKSFKAVQKESRR